MDAFQTYCEDWCINHPKMQHIKGPESPNERFFFTFGYMGMTDALRGLTPQQSPCLQMDINVSDRTTKGIQYKDYTLYFCVRASEQGDARQANEAIKECIKLKDDFLVDIENLRKIDPVVGLIDTEGVQGSSMGPFFDGWMCWEMMIEVPEAKNLCR